MATLLTSVEKGVNILVSNATEKRPTRNPYWHLVIKDDGQQGQVWIARSIGPWKTNLPLFKEIKIVDAQTPHSRIWNASDSFIKIDFRKSNS